MEKIYNKLVRDNIPEIIISNGEDPVTRVLSCDEYRDELYKKLNEECTEVINSKNCDEMLEELADVLEVIKSIALLYGKDIDYVSEIANKKRIKRGGFEKKIFLIKIIKEEENV